jgi:colanic acid biosynthesis glycosyl transferase WcaI
MRFLLYGINFAPEMTGIGKYTGELAAWLARRGHVVDVVTAPPYYPEWRVWQGYSGRRYMMENPMEGGRLSVRRCPLWVPTRVSGTTRLLHLASFALSSVPALLAAARRRPSVLVVVVPTLATAPAAWVVGRLFSIPVWLHVQDFEVDAMLDMGLVRGGTWFGRLAVRMESWVMRRFDRVSTISARMLDRLSAKGVSSERAVLFPNWVDLGSVFPLRHVSPLRPSLGLAPDQICVLYSGNMGEKQGIEILIEAAKLLLGQPHIRFVLCGTGAARARLEAASAGLPNVTWRPLQPVEKLNELLNAADIHVLPQREEAADLVMPSKLTGMLASGRATIGTAQAQTGVGKVLGQCGIRVPPGDAKALAGAIHSLADDPDRRRELGEQGRAYAAQHLGLEGILEAFEGAVRALVESDGAGGRNDRKRASE